MPYSLTTAICVIKIQHAVAIDAFLNGIELNAVSTIEAVP
tara:strand:- start:90 stop:209 length:120 start_codon:yes stop_codon:yes gene_type:complete